MIINHKKLNQTPKKNYEIVLHAMHCAPPLLHEKNPKKKTVLGKISKKNSAKTLLDWVRPPPPFGKKISVFFC